MYSVVLLIGREDGCLSTTWGLLMCEMLNKISSGRRQLIYMCAGSMEPPTHTPCGCAPR